MCFSGEWLSHHERIKPTSLSLGASFLWSVVVNVLCLSLCSCDQLFSVSCCHVDFGISQRSRLRENSYRQTAGTHLHHQTQQSANWYPGHSGNNGTAPCKNHPLCDTTPCNQCWLFERERESEVQCVYASVHLK